jgi:hypothetical protein
MPRCRRGGLVVTLVALAAGSLTGCFDDPTEVVIALDTDAKVGRDFADVQLCFSSSSGSSSEAHADGRTLPITIGVRRQGPSTAFTVLVKLNTTQSASPCNGFMTNGMTAPAFDTRTAKDVQFVDGEMRVLFLPLLKACACVDAAGMPITNCAHALDPECQDLSSPKLGEFDEDNIPHLPASAKSP